MSDYETVREYLSQKGHEGAALDREARRAVRKLDAVLAAPSQSRCPCCGLRKHAGHLLCRSCREKVCPVCGRPKGKWQFCCPEHLLEVSPEVRAKLIAASAPERNRMLAAMANMHVDERRRWDGEVV